MHFKDEGGEPKNKTNVSDVRSDDITQGNITAPVHGSHDAHEKFRSAGRKGDESETDDYSGNLEL